MSEEFTQKDILKVLKNARLFKQFEDNQLIRLISFSAVENFVQDAIILQEAQTNEKVFILLKGSVAVYAGDDFVLRLKRQGDLVGEMSVITKQPTTAKVIAEESVSLFSIHAGKINDYGQLELRSMLYKIFLDLLTEKLTMTTQRVKGFQATSEELQVKKQELAVTEDNLYQKEVILQSVLGSMSDGVVVTEENGKLLHVNEAFKKFIGKVEIPSDFELWPQKLGFFHSDEKSLYTTEELPMLKIAQGQQVDLEEIFVNNPGLSEGVWLQASSRQLKDKENKSTNGAVVVFHDYTKKKKEEQALIKAKENAEAMAKAKSDFLAVMSHELRTPLNGIMGMTDLLYTTGLTSEQKDCLDTISTSSENLLRMVKNIFDYNNLESGVVKLENENFSVKGCLDEVVGEYRIQAEKKKLHLVSLLSPDLPEKIEGFTKGIKQVLLNLTDNAIKFSEKGTIVISAHPNQIENQLLEIIFCVEDQGIGIAEGEFSNLFQPFSQVDSSYARKFEGSGIGLSICKKFIELMDGNIWIESKPGYGSKFSFSVKTATSLTNKLITTAKPATGKVAKPQILDQQFAKKFELKIMVAEDNAMNQKLITKVLNKLGYSPVIVNNGQEAVQLAETESFNMILMDLQMPELDGIEASKIISQKSIPGDRPVIIALTANVSEEVKNTCLDAGMKDYMTKPLKIDKLAEILQKWA